MSQSIKEVQEEIIEEFGILDGDMEMTNFYVMELGQKLPEFNEENKTEENIVKGCQSKVWLTAELNGDRINYQADSNTAITKGLVSLLVRIFSGQKADDIIESELFFPQKIGMERFIGTQRSNGFGAMIKQMKLYALAYKSKIEL
ncbi:MAG TPA: SufE family protein [Fulvivirga sp.]|nr:SufE family protein [Fulvivirga sp.]